MINEGRQQAIRYVEDSLFNLSPANSSPRLSTEALQLIADFFGVPTPDDVLLAAVRKTLSQLYVGIIDPSLSLYSSKRYVVGSNRPGYESTMAFVMKTDPKRRIYLTERFFQVPPFRLKSESVMRHRFDVGAHYRAASLIHELAHQVNQAHDIAYVESSAPFPDLLADPVGPEDTFKAELARLQTRSLSHRTDPGELFVTFDKTLWRDLNDWDGEGKQAVLQITGQPTLELARAVFLNDARKRSEVILKNADSIALLVVTLGRRRFN
jgi:hypothetical protein